MLAVDYDVAVIGGGPGGSTVGTLLKKYNPSIRVGIFEREVFPRDHIGESQLPGISVVLNEMGCWDKVEAANFPIKVGGTYRWGKTAELWDVEFFPAKEFRNEPRPAKYEGQRRATAFQVDRSIYDEILLDHAASLGCEVHEGSKVAEVLRTGDRVDGLRLENGDYVQAKHYVDASGNAGVLRRALGVEIDCPTSLQNIAIYDYWQNAEWAVEIGVGGTFIQVLSIGYGWIWFIPLGPTRTSIGLVIPASYYKQSGKRPQELYDQALKADERIVGLMRNATSEGKLQSTKDWSFLSNRMAGENWFLVGEAAGFADPILSAGLTMTHASARELAFTILELERGRLDPQWLKEQFATRQSLRVRNHMRFADYWYTTNAQMTDLKDFTAQIAADAGLELDPEKAWTWLAQGGFINEDLTIGTGTFTLDAVKALGEFLGELQPETPLEKNNVFRLNLTGASWSDRARYDKGTVQKSPSYVRQGRILPVDGVFELLVGILQRENRIQEITDAIKRAIAPSKGDPAMYNHLMITALRGLEAMVLDGWIDAEYDPSQPLMNLRSEYRAIHPNEYAQPSQ